MHEQDPTDIATAPHGSNAPRDGARLRRTSSGLIALVLIGVMMFLPTNFIIRAPGPVLDTLGEYEGTELISIDGATTYPSDSVLDMLTVYLIGGGSNRVTIPVLMQALFDPTRDISPEETVIPRGTTTDEQSEQSDYQMVSSQDQAVAAALTELGYDFTTWLDVADFSTGTNSEALKVGDRLLKFNGTDITSLTQLKEELNANGEAPATLTVDRTGEDGSHATTDVTVNTTAGEDGARQLGVYLNTVHEFPIDVNFGVEEIGGPSAGMMFALAIIDRLTEGSLAGDHHIAGTGEISQDGTVGAIGGIAQKLVAAQEDGATVFLAPADNCSEVLGRVPKGLDVVKVSTLDEARTALEKIADGVDPGTMSTCE